MNICKTVPSSQETTTWFLSKIQELMIVFKDLFQSHEFKQILPLIEVSASNIRDFGEFGLPLAFHFHPLTTGRRIMGKVCVLESYQKRLKEFPFDNARMPLAAFTAVYFAPEIYIPIEFQNAGKEFIFPLCLWNLIKSGKTEYQQPFFIFLSLDFKRPMNERLAVFTSLRRPPDGSTVLVFPNKVW